MPETKVFFHRRSPFNEGFPVFSVMRNEDYFLPHFLAHYRSIGAGHFVIYADRCDERFMSVLERQKDVSILLSNGVSFGEEVGVQKNGLPKRWATLLRERASNRLFRGRWHLTVDADEFLILPPGFKTLQEYTAILDDRGRSYAFAPMVDFHPRKLALRNHGADVAPFAVSHYFDAGPYHSYSPGKGISESRRKGIRRRLAAHLQKHFPEEMAKIYGTSSVMSLMAMNFKFPLLRCGAGQSRVGDHFVERMDRLNHGCALAHFKFYPGLDQKVATALAEGQYFRGSLEYKFIDLAIRKLNNADLLCQSSVNYREPADLVSAKLIDTAD
jgi:hypothetical protein